jgi:hypothetical protein
MLVEYVAIPYPAIPLAVDASSSNKAREVVFPLLSPFVFDGVGPEIMLRMEEFRRRWTTDAVQICDSRGLLYRKTSLCIRALHDLQANMAEVKGKERRGYVQKTWRVTGKAGKGLIEFGKMFLKVETTALSKVPGQRSG